MLRRHRLIELFLVRTLQLTWDEVHDEAEHMEHAVSDLLVDRIDEYLGPPGSRSARRPDPAGRRLRFNPRLSFAGHMSRGRRFPAGASGRSIARFLAVSSQPPALPLGIEGRVAGNHAEAGLVIVEVAGKTIHLGRSAAEKILITEP